MKSEQKPTRRDFITRSTILGTGILFAQNLFAKDPLQNATAGGVQIGVITYSFRSMPGSVEALLQYCRQCGIIAIELMGDPAEAYAGSPAGLMPPMAPTAPGAKPPTFTPEMRKAREERALKARGWRENVTMDKFIELRTKFNKAGISVYAYKPDALGEKNTGAEIEYAMKAAKAIGASSVTVELPQNPAHSKRLGDIAAKYQVYVGYHAHTQATDTAWDEALAQSPYNSMNLDCGHYIAAGGHNTKESLLALITAKNDRITSLHIKDRQSKENGALNLEWGKGDTPIKEILLLMKKNNYKFPATIELEYHIPPGSDAVQEVKKCVAYANTILKN
jgi:sugar phosphate isomerase/epimerase